MPATRRKMMGATMLLVLIVCCASDSAAEDQLKPTCDGTTVKVHKMCGESPYYEQSIQPTTGKQNTCRDLWPWPCAGYEGYDAPSDNFSCKNPPAGQTTHALKCGPQIAIAPGPLPVPYQVQQPCFVYQKCQTNEDGNCRPGVWETIYRPVYEYKDCEIVTGGPGGPA
jgi:hypothetical protein